MNIYALTIKQFKNLLVTNKYLAYQNQLEDILYHPFYGRSYNQLTLDEKTFYKNNKMTNCQQRCYYNAGLQYIKTCSLENYKHDINYYTTYKTINYDTFINAKYQSMNNIKVKEFIWLNTKQEYLLDKINITGNFTISTNKLSTRIGELSYIPNIPYGLTLNNIPVSYISGCTGGHYKFRERYQHCLKIEFTFDLTTYCKVIDCVLKCRKYTHNYFGKLPFELIKYILYLTSL